MAARHRKINQGIATIVVRDKKLLRTFALYADLSQLTEKRVIHNYEKRIEQLANTADLCVPTFKKYIKEIIRKKWAWMDGKNLCFLGRRKFAKKMGVAYKDYWTIEAYDFRDIELHLRALAIQENIKKQNKTIDKKVIQRAIKKAKIICKDIKIKYAKTLDKEKERAKLRAVNIIAPINKEATLSRKGISNLYNLKAARSGSYWMNKLNKRRIVKDERQQPVYLGKMSKDYFRELQMTSHRYLYLDNGVCYARLPNIVGYSGQVGGLQSI